MGKLPQPGRVKTRLCPPLTPEQAAGVHELFLRHTLHRLLETAPAADIGRVILCFDPPDAAPKVLQSFAMAGEVGFLPQGPGNLGDRLTMAADKVAGPVLFLGCDSPDLPLTHLIFAGRCLCKGRKIVLGPCDDGGFWCLGVAPGVDLRPVLAGVEWSSGGEMEQVRRNAEAAGLSVDLAPPWYDIDRPADLTTLWNRLEDDPLAQRLAGHLLHLLPRHLLQPTADRTDPESL